MNKIAYTLIITLTMVMNSFAQTTLFDFDWKFHRGGAQRAEMPDFDDSKWRKVDLPHDWSIEDLPGSNPVTIGSPFDPDAISQVSGGFTVGGTGWYRKTFSIPAAEKGKRIHVQFDGIYMNSDLWLNGVFLGKHPYGYTSFWFDVTDKIKFGEKNTISVQVKNEGQNSRWYSGSGIYRHVWLKVLDPIHIIPWGVYVTTPEVNSTGAKVKLEINVINERKNAVPVRVVTRILDPSGKEVGKTESSLNMEGGSEQRFNHEVNVQNPRLWDLQSPSLYTAVSEVYDADKRLDEIETKFGIRTIAYNVTNGFQLNGKTVKMKGGCVHHDNGPLGSRTYDRAEERRIELLKASGYNAIRCSHNPPSPAFLDACDRLGMLVIDEAFDMWRIENNPHDYHLYFDEYWQKDIESMVFRDRNHPSIVLWSIGNEIRGMETPEVVNVAKMLGDHIRKLDPTRPITAAVNGLRPQKDPFFATLDIGGYNYATGGDHLQKSIYVLDHERLPARIMFGSESYPLEAFGAWMDVIDNSWVLGDFVWTAFDYIGEASIGWRGYWQEWNFYPWNLAYCGDIDICGWKRPQSYYRDALWMENKIAVFVKPPKPTFPFNPDKQSWSKWEWHDVVADWNWAGYENKPLDISVYSSCEEVELLLNGKSLGRKKTNRDSKFIAAWQVPYQAGTLKAVGYTGGKQIATSQLQTAKTVSKFKLSPDRTTIKADGQDLSYITVELLDENGVRHPKAENLVTFNVDGGTIVGVGNANPMSLESYQSPRRKAWQGKCLVIVKSTTKPGTISLTATAAGLKPVRVSIQSK